MLADHQCRCPLWYKQEQFLLQLKCHNLQIFYHLHLFNEANIITQLLFVMLCWSLWWTSFAVEPFLQVINNKFLSNKTCFLLECNCQTCRILEMHDHQCHCMSQWLVWARQNSLAQVCECHCPSILPTAAQLSGWWVLKMDIFSTIRSHITGPLN